MSRFFQKRSNGRPSYHARIIALIGIAFLAGLTTPGCRRKAAESTGTPPSTISALYRNNRPPLIRELFAESRGRRIPVVYPDMVVTVKALATDPDGDALHYRWIVAPGSGKISSPTEPEATWHVGQGEGLMLIISDGKGGQARAYLKITEKGKVLFSGLVVSKDGLPIEAADVDAAGVTAKTDSKGLFQLEVKPEKTSRYVLNIRKAGYGLVSRIYGRGVSNGKWVMTKGTVAVVDPRQPIRVRDTGARVACQGRLGARIDWSRYPVQKIPNVFNAAGRPLGNDMPPAVSEALRLLQGGTACNPGIQLSLPANALVDASGNAPA